MGSSHNIERSVNLNANINVNLDQDSELRIEKLKEQLAAAQKEIAQLNMELDEMRQKLSESADAKFVEDLKHRLEGAESKLRSMGDSIVAQFDAFRTAFNLDKIDNADFTRWSEQLRNGLIGLPQAMSEVKAKYGELMGLFGSTGASVGGDALQPILTKLNEMSMAITELTTKLTGVASGAAGSAGVSGGAANATGLLEEITKATQSMGAEARESAQSIASLARELTALGGIEARNLYNLSSLFQGLAGVAKGGIGSATVANVTALADKLREIGDRGPITVDFSGFKDLKISKASMNNLAEYLPKIADVNVDNLTKLSNVNLTNFNNLKVNKGAAEELAKIAEAIQIYKEAKAGSVNVSDSGVMISGAEVNSVADGIEKVSGSANILNKVTSQGTTAIKEYINAENTLKEVVTSRINKQGEREEISRTTEYIGRQTEQKAEAERIYTEAVNASNSALTKYGETLHWLSSDGQEAYQQIQHLGWSFDIAKDAYQNGELSLDAYMRTLLELTTAQDEYLVTLRNANREYEAGVTTGERASNKEHEAEETRKAREETEESTRVIREQTAAYDQYQSAITSAIGALQKFVGAKTDGSDTAQEAYARVQNTARAIRDLYAEYQRSGNFSAFQSGMAEQVAYLSDNISNLSAVRRADADAAKQQQIAQKLYDDTLKQGTSALVKYASAQTSSKASVRAAYSELSNSVATMQRLNDEYRAGKYGPEEYAEKVRGVAEQMRQSTSVLSQNTSTMRSHGAQIKSAIAMYFSFHRAVFLVIRSIRNMIKEAIELDTALTQMQIVTGDTNSQMARFADTAFEAANRTGSAVTDVISGATTYARLGFGSEMSARLAELTTMLQNVGAIDAQDAQDAITAIIKAFDGVDENNLESKLDKLVTVGNNFPISVSQIAEGMNNASSSLAAAGNTFEQSVALLTAANTTMQNAAKASTGLRTITARLRNTKTELDDLGESMTESQYDDVVKALTNMHVSLVDVNGDYRTTYEIFKDIAAQWDEMSSTEQAALATKLSGTRMQAVFYSLVQNFGEAEKAYEAMAGAEGTLEEKNEVFINSIQGRINQFKNDFAKLATTIFQSDWIKEAVEAAKDLLQILAGIAKAIINIVKTLGGVKSTLVALAAIFGTIKIANMARSIVAVTEAIKKATAATTTFTTAQKIASYASREVVTSTAAAKAALVSYGVTAGVVAVVAIAGIVSSIIQKKRQEAEDAAAAFGKLNDEIKESEEKISSLNSELKTNKDRLEELSRISSPTYVEQAELDRLKETTAELEKQIADEEELLGYRRSQKAGTFANSMWNTFFNGANSNILPDKNKYGFLYGAWNLEGPHTRVTTESGQDVDLSFLPSWRQSDIDMLFSLPGLVEQIRAVVDDLGDNTNFWVDFGGMYGTDQFHSTKELKEFLDNVTSIYKSTIINLKDLTKGMEFIPEPTTKDEEDADWYLRKINSIISLYEQMLGDDPGGQKAFARTAEMYGYETYDDFLTSLNNGDQAAKWFLDDLRDMGINVGVLTTNLQGAADEGNVFAGLLLKHLAPAADNLGQRFELLADSEGDVKDGADNATQSLSHLRDVINGFSKLTTGLDLLDKVYADVVDAGNFDYTALVDEKFVEEFAPLGKAYDEFIETVSNSPKDISACQAAFNRLTQEYILQSGYIKELNEDNKDLLIQMLEEKGVANASAVVNQLLAVSLYNVAIEKLRVGETKIDSTDDVDQLLKMAQAAGVAQEELDKLVKIRALVDRLSSMPVGSQQAMAYAHEVERLIAELKDITPEPIELPDIVFTGGAETQKVRDAATKEAEKAAKDTKTWFEEQYAEHKHLVAMEKETDYEYYTWLEGAMKKAYAEGILSQEDYWKYEEEVYNGMKKLRENAEKEAQSNFDKLVDIRKKMLEKEVSDQKDALNDELKNLKDFYDKQRKMLQDSYDEEDYLEEQAEKRKSVSDLEEELARLRYDDSAWAQKRRAEISQQIADARKDLNDFERDHARDEALSFLDEQESAAEEKINAQIDSLEERAKSAKELNEQAITDVKNGTAELYREMIAWNAEYGDGLTETVTAAWNGLYQAASDYKQLVGTIFNGVKIANVAGYKLKPIGTGYASGTSYATPGLHPIDEKGSETYFSPSTGGKYKMFSGGEKVLTAKASEFLYRFANGGSEMLKKFIASVGGGVLNDRLTPLMTNNEIVMGDVIVNGNADRATVSEIRRAQRESVEFMLKEFGKLNR